jgi:hypothetical protein
MRKFMGTAAVLCLATALSPLQDASAKTRHAKRHHADYAYADGYARRPVVVERRSFLDPGTVVPVGTYNHYVYDRPYANGDPVGTYQAGTFMMDTLHPAMGASPEHGFYGY